MFTEFLGSQSARGALSNMVKMAAMTTPACAYRSLLNRESGFSINLKLKNAKSDFGEFHLDRRGKIVLLALFLFVMGIMVTIGSFVQNIVVGYTLGLGFALLGSVFMVVNSE